MSTARFFPEPAFVRQAVRLSRIPCRSDHLHSACRHLGSGRKNSGVMALEDLLLSVAHTCAASTALTICKQANSVPPQPVQSTITDDVFATVVALGSPKTADLGVAIFHLYSLYRFRVGEQLRKPDNITRKVATLIPHLDHNMPLYANNSVYLQ